MSCCRGVVDDVPVAAEDEDVPGGAELDVLAEARDDLVVQVDLDEPGRSFRRARLRQARTREITQG